LFNFKADLVFLDYKTSISAINLKNDYTSGSF